MIASTFMSLLAVRDLLDFPAGDNSTDTIVAGVHFNLTTLNHWNYTYYSNETFSNISNCVLTFQPYTPTLLANGTFLNSTSCYNPIKPMGTRSNVGVVMGVYFGLSIMFTLINLRKHGRLFLPSQKRFRAVGRRWQWYWMLFVAGCAMISCFTGVDVDRYWVMEVPIVLSSLFWLMMLPSTMASVWESVRHWGSWEERQLIDPNPFVLSQDDKRGKTEFYMPLVFYLFAFLTFFMAVPRGWVPLEEQRSPDQTAAVAEPLATDGRFKAAAFLLFCSWLVILFSLRHSIHHYKPRNRGFFKSFIGGIKYTPWRFFLTLPLSLVMIGYEAASAFIFEISPLNANANPAYIYGLGWAPIALIFLIHEISGYVRPNEDRELIRQRRVRGAEIDAEMGLTKKPNWWSRLNGDHNLSVNDAIAKNVNEIGGSATTKKTPARGIEMSSMPSTSPKAPRNADKSVSGSGPAWRASQRREERLSKNETPESLRIAASLLFPTPPGMSEPLNPFGDSSESRGRVAAGDGASSITRDETFSDRSLSVGSGVSGATTLNAQPQKIKSMLDV